MRCERAWGFQRRTTVCVRLTAAVLLAGCVLGCAAGPRRDETGSTSTGNRGIGRWFIARGMDLLDTVEVGVGAGPGVQAQVHYGLGTWGLGAWSMWRASLGNRWPLRREHMGMSVCYMPPPLQPILGAPRWESFIARNTFEDALYGLLAGLLGFTEYSLFRPDVISQPPYSAVPVEWARFGPVVKRKFRQYEYEGRLSGKSFAIGAEADFLVGAKAMVYPLEIADLFAGFFGVDFLGDDEYTWYPGLSPGRAEQQWHPDPSDSRDPMWE